MQLILNGAVVGTAEGEREGRKWYRVSFTDRRDTFSLYTSPEVLEVCKKYLLKEGSYTLNVSMRDVGNGLRVNLVGISPMKV